MDQIQDAAEVVNQRIKQKRCRKSIGQPVQVITYALVSEFDRTISDEVLRDNARKLKEVYSLFTEAGLAFAAEVFKYLVGPSTRYHQGRMSGTRAETVCCALLDGILDFLEEKNSAVATKSVIAKCLYAPLCEALMPVPYSFASISKSRLGNDLLFRIYTVFSETTQKHLDNKILLRSPEVLGSQRLGCLLHTAPDSGALEALLDVIGVLLPQEKTTPEEQAERDAFIHGVFAAPGSGDTGEEQALVKLAATSSRNWGKTSDQIIAELARRELRFPQPMLVQEVHIGTCGFQLDSFYVDERSLTATTTRDGARVPLRITFPSIMSVEYLTPIGSHVCDITISLSDPPILASTSLSFPGKTPEARFQLDEKSVDRFKEAMASRIQRDILNHNGKRVSLADVPIMRFIPQDKTAAPLLDKDSMTSFAIARSLDEATPPVQCLISTPPALPLPLPGFLPEPSQVQPPLLLSSLKVLPTKKPRAAPARETTKDRLFGRDGDDLSDISDYSEPPRPASVKAPAGAPVRAMTKAQVKAKINELPASEPAAIPKPKAKPKKAEPAKESAQHVSTRKTRAYAKADEKAQADATSSDPAQLPTAAAPREKPEDIRSSSTLFDQETRKTAEPPAQLVPHAGSVVPISDSNPPSRLAAKRPLNTREDPDTTVSVPPKRPRIMASSHSPSPAPRRRQSGSSAATKDHGCPGKKAPTARPAVGLPEAPRTTPSNARTGGTPMMVTPRANTIITPPSMVQEAAYKPATAQPELQSVLGAPASSRAIDRAGLSMNGLLPKPSFTQGLPSVGATASNITGQAKAGEAVEVLKEPDQDLDADFDAKAAPLFGQPENFVGSSPATSSSPPVSKTLVHPSLPSLQHSSSSSPYLDITVPRLSNQLTRAHKTAKPEVIDVDADQPHIITPLRQKQPDATSDFVRFTSACPRIEDGHKSQIEGVDTQYPRTLRLRQPPEAPVVLRRKTEPDFQADHADIESREPLHRIIYPRQQPAPLPMHNQLQFDMRTPGRPNINLTPQSFDYTIVEEWDAALEQERPQPPVRERATVLPTNTKKVVFEDSMMSGARVPTWTSHEKSPARILPRQPPRTYARPVPRQQDTDEDQYVYRTWDGEMRSISEVVHQISDALLEKIDARFQDVRDVAYEGQRRVYQAAAQQLTEMRNEMVAHHRSLVALESEYATFGNESLQGLRRIEGAQKHVAAGFKTLVREHDKGMLSTKLPRSLAPSPDQLPPSLR